MLKKTMIVVGAIVAATISMSDIASATPHRHFQGHGTGFAARLPRRAFSHVGHRFTRPAWRHVASSRGTRLARSAAFASRHAASQMLPYAPRHAQAWHRLATRRRMALAYSAVRVPSAGFAPVAVPAAPAGTAPGNAVPATAAPSVVYRRGAWHRVATRRRVALAYNAVPAPAASLVPFSVPAPVVAAPRVALPASHAQMGQASYYSSGGRTAAGGRVGAATCAHRSLPFGTRVLVTNLANARSAVLTVNDRGPFVRGRIVDVSVGAAGVLGMLHSGTAPVRVQVVSR